MNTSIPTNVQTEIDAAIAAFEGILIKYQNATRDARVASWVAGILALIIAGLTTFSALQNSEMQRAIKITLAILGIVAAIATWYNTEASKAAEMRLTGANEIKVAIVEITNKVIVNPEPIKHQEYILDLKSVVAKNNT